MTHDYYSTNPCNVTNLNPWKLLVWQLCVAYVLCNDGRRLAKACDSHSCCCAGSCSTVVDPTWHMVLGCQANCFGANKCAQQQSWLICPQPCWQHIAGSAAVLSCLFSFPAGVADDLRAKVGFVQAISTSGSLFKTESWVLSGNVDFWKYQCWAAEQFPWLFESIRHLLSCCPWQDVLLQLGSGARRGNGISVPVQIGSCSLPSH